MYSGTQKPIKQCKLILRGGQMKVNNSWESLFWSIVAKDSLWNLQQEKSQTHDTNDNSYVNNKTRFLCDDTQRRITYFLIFYNYF